MNEKIIFWNVDTQYDFMRPDGKLPVPDATKIETVLDKITSYAKSNDIKVVNTADWHTLKDEEIDEKNPDLNETYPPHCMAETKGAEYVPATKPEDPYIIDDSFDENALREHRNVVLHKQKFDVYAGNSLTEKVVDSIDPKAIVVYGVASNVCVHDAVVGHAKRGRDVYVIKDAIQGLPHLEESKERSMAAVKGKWDELNVKTIPYDSLEEVVKAYK